MTFDNFFPCQGAESPAPPSGPGHHRPKPHVPQPGHPHHDGAGKPKSHSI